MIDWLKCKLDQQMLLQVQQVITYSLKTTWKIYMTTATCLYQQVSAGSTRPCLWPRRRTRPSAPPQHPPSPCSPPGHLSTTPSHRPWHCPWHPSLSRPPWTPAQATAALIASTTTTPWGSLLVHFFLKPKKLKPHRPYNNLNILICVEKKQGNGWQTGYRCPMLSYATCTGIKQIRDFQLESANLAETIIEYSRIQSVA